MLVTWQMLLKWLNELHLIYQVWWYEVTICSRLCKHVILCVTETWLLNHIALITIMHSCYSLFRKVLIIANSFTNNECISTYYLVIVSVKEPKVIDVFLSSFLIYAHYCYCSGHHVTLEVFTTHCYQLIQSMHIGINATVL